MSIVVGILLALHLIGWAIALGGTLVAIKRPKVYPSVAHGLYLALAAGLAITGIGGAQQWDLNYPKIALKLALAVVATVMAVIGKGNPERVTRTYLAGIAGLIVVNVFLAVLWNGEEV